MDSSIRIIVTFLLVFTLIVLIRELYVTLRKYLPTHRMLKEIKKVITGSTYITDYAIDILAILFTRYEEYYDGLSDKITQSLDRTPEEDEDWRDYIMEKISISILIRTISSVIMNIPPDMDDLANTLRKTTEDNIQDFKLTFNEDDFELENYFDEIFKVRSSMQEVCGYHYKPKTFIRGFTNTITEGNRCTTRLSKRFMKDVARFIAVREFINLIHFANCEEGGKKSMHEFLSEMGVYVYVDRHHDAGEKEVGARVYQETP